MPLLMTALILRLTPAIALLSMLLLFLMLLVLRASSTVTSTGLWVLTMVARCCTQGHFTLLCSTALHRTLSLLCSHPILVLWCMCFTVQACVLLTISHTVLCAVGCAFRCSRSGVDVCGGLCVVERGRWWFGVCAVVMLFCAVDALLWVWV